MPSQNVSDACLLAGMLVDDQDAWRLFVSRHHTPIIASIQRVLRRFPAAARTVELDDVYASFLMSLVQDDKRKLRAYDPARGSLRQWMILLATNMTFDHTRSTARRPRRADVARLDSVPATNTDALTHLLARDECERLARAMDSMSRRDQDLVGLLFARGVRPFDAASELGISVKSIYSKLHKIRDRLGGRDQLSGEQTYAH